MESSLTRTHPSESVLVGQLMTDALTVVESGCRYERVAIEIELSRCGEHFGKPVHPTGVLGFCDLDNACMDVVLQCFEGPLGDGVTSVKP